MQKIIADAQFFTIFFPILLCLKRVASILLLAMLLFNWIGFRLLYNVIEHQANQDLAAKIDRLEFSEQDLVTIKVPLNLPYQQNWEEFERYDGDVTVDGVHYKYVMRRIYNDSLVLKCIPNETKQQLKNAERQYFQLVNDLEHQGQQQEKSKVSFFKNLVTEFWDSKTSYVIDPIFNMHTSSRVNANFLVAAGHLSRNDCPPQS